MTKEDLVLEINPKLIDSEANNFKIGNMKVMFTPNIGEDYWNFRVQVDKDQSVLGFEKFFSIGIGFAKEDDWNTNLPSTCTTDEIWEHIKENKYYASIPDELCIEAIKMIQKAVDEMDKASFEAEKILALANEPMLLNEDTGKILSFTEFKKRCHVVGKGSVERFIILFGYNRESNVNWKYKMHARGFTKKDKALKYAYKNLIEAIAVDSFPWCVERGSFKVPMTY